MSTIILSIIALGGMGLAIGVGLSLAEKKFKVEVDPRLEEISAILPGVNCGACGLPGCGNFAQAVLKGEEGPTDCPVGGPDLAQALGAILGVKVKETVALCAYIRCAGGESNSDFRYQYYGMNDCSAAMQMAAGGSKACSYGCLGGGSCILACDFDAIVMEDGIARIDNEKCVACGLCVPACPKKLIEMVPKHRKVRVACYAQDPARVVRVNCRVGCISCKLCEKACDYAAIHVYDQLAMMDYEKCTDCGDCIAKCPTKCIVKV